MANKTTRCVTFVDCFFVKYCFSKAKHLYLCFGVCYSSPRSFLLTLLEKLNHHWFIFFFHLLAAGMAITII